MQTSTRHIVLLHHFRRFLIAAHQRGIRVAPLKGAYLVEKVYPPEHERREMSDVDFLVPPQDYQRAGELLEELGFNRKPYPYRHIQRHESGYGLKVTRDREILFEVHRFLLDPVRFEIDHDQLWQRARPIEFDSTECFELALEDHFVFIAFHGLLHRLTPTGETERDLVYLLRYTDIDRGAIARTATCWQMRRVIWYWGTQLRQHHSDLGLDGLLADVAPPLLIRAAIVRASQLAEQWPTENLLKYRLRALLIWPLLFDRRAQFVKMAITHPAVRELWARCQRVFR